MTRPNEDTWHDCRLQEKNLIWDYIIVPIWRSGANCPNPKLNRAKIKPVIQRADDPGVAMEATEKNCKILDSKYEKVNL